MKKTLLNLILFLAFCFKINAQNSQGYFEEVLSLINEGKVEEAEVQLKKQDNKSDAEYIYLVGEVELRKGKMEEAIDSFEKAAQKSSSDVFNAMCYSSIGVALWAKGDYMEATDYHLKAIRIREKIRNENPSVLADSYNNIGLVYMQLEPEKALKYYTQALNIYKSGGVEKSKEKEATTFVNIGLALNALKQHQNAITQLNNALEVRKKLYPDGHPNIAFVYSSLGLVYEAKEDFEEALEKQETALSMYKKFYGDKHPEISNTYNLIGNILLKQEEYVGALLSWQKAICANIPGFDSKDYSVNPESIDNSYNDLTLLNSLMLKAKGLESLHFGKKLLKKDLVMSLSTLKKCDELIDKIRQSKTQEKDKLALGEIASEVYASGVSVCFSLENISFKKGVYLEEAFYFAEKSKSAILLSAISETNAKSYAGIPNNLILKEKDLKADISFLEQKLAEKPDQKEEKSLRNKLFQLRASYKDFVSKLESDFPQYFNLKYNISIPTIDQLQEKIDENTAVLSYFYDENANQVYAFSISKYDVKAWNLTPKDDLAKLVLGFRNSIEYDLKDVFVETARDLYQSLFPHSLTTFFKKFIPKNTENLIIIPSGIMGQLPFEALLRRKAGEEDDFREMNYLISDYSVSYYYSSSLLEKEGNDLKEEKIALFGPVKFGYEGLTDLPGSEIEIKELKTAFEEKKKTAKIFLKEDATEENVKDKNIASNKFLHFATHGIVDEESPELSRIFLHKKVKSSEDGSLFSGEIYNLNFNSDLVTLSACQTGLGKTYKGEGIIGLSRALIYAGAKNLIVSLWSVADQSTSNLMIDFYKNIIDSEERNAGKYSKPLQRAKLNLINSEKYSAPFFWAPFILIGK